MGPNRNAVSQPLPVATLLTRRSANLADSNAPEYSREWVANNLPHFAYNKHCTSRHAKPITEDIFIDIIFRVTDNVTDFATVFSPKETTHLNWVFARFVCLCCVNRIQLCVILVFKSQRFLKKDSKVNFKKSVVIVESMNSFWKFVLVIRCNVFFVLAIAMIASNCYRKSSFIC